MAQFKLPTEIIKLPSKGLVYPKDNPLSSGEIEMKYMTAREEDILTNTNYIQQGVAIDKMFSSLIITKINYDDLISGDKDGIMIASRILGYGKNYPVKYKHPLTGVEEDFTVDLTQIAEKPFDESKFNNKNEFEFVLPVTGNVVTFKLSTHGDEKKIEAEINATKKIRPANEITTRLKHLILSVNGDYEKKTVIDFVDTALLAGDSIALRKYIREISPGMNLTFKFVASDGYVQEGVSLPIGLSFFYPDLA
jgi:hypothetical protein